MFKKEWPDWLSAWPLWISLAAGIVLIIAITNNNLKEEGSTVLYFPFPPIAGSYTNHVSATAAQQQCVTQGTGCATAELQVINKARIAIGRAPLKLDWTERNGNSSCPGTIGHVKAMVLTGSIWHISPTPQYDYASFPKDICESVSSTAENVAACGQGINEWQQIECGFNLYMSEPHDAAYCAALVEERSANHACSILSPSYSRVGIAFQHGNAPWGSAWFQAQDFLG